MIIAENPGLAVSKPEEVHRFIMKHYLAEDSVERDKEHFWVLGLNTKNEIRYMDLCSLGILDAALVAPREVFRYAIQRGVASIIVAHNHPSGDVKPSRQDEVLTQRLTDSGHLLGIPMLDHIIVAEGKFYSFSGLCEKTVKKGLPSGPALLAMAGPSTLPLF